MAAKTTGERIRERRIQLGITASELAARLGKDRSTIYYYENGKVKDIPMKTINEIAGILDVSASYLLGFGANEKPGLLEQDRANGNKHDTILTPNQHSVKANWLEDFRACHPKIKDTEIVEAIRLSFPGFDKTLLSKCKSPEKYGVELSEAVKTCLVVTFEERDNT